MAAYGWAMWAVQQFEHNLAGLGILRSPVKSADRRLDSAQKVYSALEKQFVTYQHRFERASVKELRDLLPGDLPEPLESELDGLISARNDLAHRYVRRVLAKSAIDFRREVQTVQALGQRFSDAGKQLTSLMEQATASRQPNLSDIQYGALQKLGRAAAGGTSLPDALTSLARPDES